MTRNTVTTSIALCLLLLAGCTSAPTKNAPVLRLKALLEPQAGPTKQINELETERDEQTYIVQADATIAKYKGNNLQAIELLEKYYGCKDTWFQRVRGKGCKD